MGGLDHRRARGSRPGRGRRAAAFRRGVALAHHRVDAYLAVVHVDNVASRRLFVNGGYAPDLPADADGFERWVRTVR